MTNRDFVKIAKALSDPTRVKILQEVRRGQKMNCSEVCGCFRLSQPTISHHLGTLAAAGLIKVTKRGQYHIVTANEGTLTEFGRVLSGSGALLERAAGRRKSKSA